jgi:hypothetical protein
MSLSIRWPVVLFLLFAWVGPAEPARAVFPPAIKDEGKLFSAETLDRANKKIHDIYRTFHNDVVIEALAKIPADLETKYKEDGRQKFFSEWADRRVDELGVNGLYILIVKEPGHIQVSIDMRTRAKAFTPSDRRKLIDKMLGAFKEKKLDEGLLTGLDFVESTFKAHAGK